MDDQISENRGGWPSAMVDEARGAFRIIIIITIIIYGSFARKDSRVPSSMKVLRCI